MNRARIQARWHRLCDLAAAHTPWQMQLSGYAPPSLARCLVASDAMVERLALVLDRGLQGSVAAAKLKRVGGPRGPVDGLFCRV